MKIAYSMARKPRKKILENLPKNDENLKKVFLTMGARIVLKGHWAEKNMASRG